VAAERIGAGESSGTRAFALTPKDCAFRCRPEGFDENGEAFARG